jgi:NAD(P)-dependent dehydrogenase (short-subunit alcohol dehydrogenase family)
MAAAYQQECQLAMSPRMARLEGKVAIITGAASGIGKASVELFRAEGATAIGADVSDGADVRCDAGNEDDVKQLIKQTAAKHGRLDIFFANAGVSGGWATISEQSAADWAEILRINLIGPFLAIKYAAPLMKEGGGSIICTASVAGLRSGAGGAAYSASKAGVINLVQTAAQQLSGTGVRVNAICPGLIETGMTKGIYDMARDSGQAHRIGELNPLQRGGEPIEIANAALFLASDEASYVNGAALVVDGGLSSSHPTTRRFDLRML